MASSPDFVVAMNQPSLVRFQNHIRSGGILFINSSIVETKASRGDIEIVEVPASGMADEMKSPKSANMIMLGAFVRKTGLVALSTLVQGLESTMKGKPKLIDINKRALEAGHRFLQ